MILIFDTFGGLCNQFYDINCGINFCLINNIKFSFRYCSFRNDNLVSWRNEPFDKLFDTEFLNKYKPLYIPIRDIILNKENTYNYANTVNSNKIINDEDDILTKLIRFNKEYVILRQFYGTYKFKKIIDNVNNFIIPSNKLLDKYVEIKNNILQMDKQYNFIHYRYESDFTWHFKLVNTESLGDLIERLKLRFKNPSLKIYIATTNIENLIDLNNIDVKNTILTKNEDELTQYNFEEKAFIDYMFGKNSEEVFGHKLSSFSFILNQLKKTNNYYNVT
jgi:hypothetical protein